ncbi:MAG: Ig-like domain-containing protein, partial [Pseudomonadota bacterium]
MSDDMFMLMIEAEDFPTRDNLVQLQDTDVPFASNGAVIRPKTRAETEAIGEDFDPDQSATASFVFTGPDGIYTIAIDTFDESDGAGSITLLTNGGDVETQVLDGALPDAFPSENNQVSLQFVNVFLRTNDSIGVRMTKEGGELPRFDKLTAVKVNDFGGNPDAPQAITDNVSILEDEGTATFDVLANDTDANDTVPDDITITGTTDGTFGTTQITGGGKTVDYTITADLDMLNEGETLTDSFTYSIDDSLGNDDGGQTGFVNVTITGENDPPVAAGDQMETVSAAGPPLTAAFDADDPDSEDDQASLDYTFLGIPAGGEFTINVGQGTFNFDPDGDFDGLAPGQTQDVAVSYEAADSRGETDIGLITVTIEGAAGPAPMFVFEGEDLALTDLVVQDTDVPFASNQAVVRPLLNREVSGGNAPAFGLADGIFDGPTGTYTVEAVLFDENDGVGSFDFFVDGGLVGSQFLVEDGPGGSPFPTPDNATTFIFDDVDIANGDAFRIGLNRDGGEFPRLDFVKFTQTSTSPDAPVAMDDLFTVNENDIDIALNILQNDTDANDTIPDDITVTLDTTGTLGSVFFDETNNVARYDGSTAFAGLNDGDVGFDSFSYTIDDSLGNNDGADTATVNINVLGEGMAPPPDMRFEVEDLMGDDFFVVQDTDVPFASEQAVGRVILRREASDEGLI